MTTNLKIRHCSMTGQRLLFSIKEEMGIKCAKGVESKSGITSSFV